MYVPINNVVYCVLYMTKDTSVRFIKNVDKCLLRVEEMHMNKENTFGNTDKTECEFHNIQKERVIYDLSCPVKSENGREQVEESMQV